MKKDRQQPSLGTSFSHRFFGRHENSQLQGLWKQHFSICSSVVLTEIWGRIGANGIYSGRHLGYLSMYIFRVSNRFRHLTAENERPWNTGGKGKAVPSTSLNRAVKICSLCTLQALSCLSLAALIFTPSWITQPKSYPGVGVQNHHDSSHSITGGSHRSQPCFINAD